MILAPYLCQRHSYAQAVWSASFRTPPPIRQARRTVRPIRIRSNRSTGPSCPGFRIHPLPPHLALSISRGRITHKSTVTTPTRFLSSYRFPFGEPMSLQSSPYTPNENHGERHPAFHPLRPRDEPIRSMRTVRIPLLPNHTFEPSTIFKQNC